MKAAGNRGLRALSQGFGLSRPRIGNVDRLKAKSARRRFFREAEPCAAKVFLKPVRCICYPLSVRYSAKKAVEKGLSRRKIARWTRLCLIFTMGAVIIF